MTQPISYLQTDPRWANRDYSAPGEKTTIGKSGCGPTSMAMVLATWVDPLVNPKTECAWALAHGHKAPHQGTYYGYFEKAGERYGLKVTRLNYSSLYKNSNSSLHARAKQEIEKGNLVIACMGPGNWTSSGHYVLVWNIIGDVIYINDPASTKTVRTKGSYSLFKKQVKYYWVIENPNKGKDELDMTKKEFLNSLTDEEAYLLLQKAELYAKNLPEPAWSKKEGSWSAAKAKGVIDGTSPERSVKRDEMAAILYRLGLLK